MTESAFRSQLHIDKSTFKPKEYGWRFKENMGYAGIYSLTLDYKVWEAIDSPELLTVEVRKIGEEES